MFSKSTQRLSTISCNMNTSKVVENFASHRCLWLNNKKNKWCIDDLRADAASVTKYRKLEENK